jgi:hypothetical protein
VPIPFLSIHLEPSALRAVDRCSLTAELPNAIPMACLRSRLILA